MFGDRTENVRKLDRSLAAQNLWDTRGVLVCQVFWRLGAVAGESEISPYNTGSILRSDRL